MNVEANRLNTFSNWPTSAPVDPIRIAKAGFFHTGDGTEVECFSCGGKISQWNYGDQVMSRHRQMKPDCPFVLYPELSGNVPLILGRECPTTPISSSTINMEQSDVNATPQGQQDYGLTVEDEMYKSEPLRLVSFINWNDPTVTREALVHAGFYNAGEGRLRCAWCGGQLSPFRNFGSLGQPIEVHRMYFPRCEYAARIQAEQRRNSVAPASEFTMSLLRDPTVISPQSSAAEHNSRLLQGGSTWRMLGVVGGGARHAQHAALAARLATFRGWPCDRAQTPNALAEAGFFYAGTEDQVRCFYCDGGLGKWESGDAPWAEHARWFPHCGYVLLVKGQQFVDACRQTNSSSNSGRTRSRRQPAGVNFPVNESQLEACMEGPAALAALGAGLDAARVRRALARRLRATGQPFSSSEALIDAVLDGQLNEESWSVSPNDQRRARDILAETLREFAPSAGLIPPQEENSERSSSSSPAASPSPTVNRLQLEPDSSNSITTDSINNTADTESKEKNEQKEPVKKLTLEEENRQLKEARLCKVCMDSEVSVVFLPCGHLVSCGGCGAALSACPLCRCAVKALVRAYLA